MTDDIQQETECIEGVLRHPNIVDSLSFSDALANRDAEIARLRRELEGADRVANSFAQTACLRGARMQVMREWMKCTELMWNCTHRPWDMFIESRPDAAAWFDDEGVPR